MLRTDALATGIVLTPVRLDTLTRSISLLGSLAISSPEIHRVPAIVVISKTPFSHDAAASLTGRLISRTEVIEENDIVGAVSSPTLVYV